MTRSRAAVAAHRDAWSGPAGRNRRKDWYRAHGRRCRICGRTDDLELHHLTYQFVTGLEPDWALVSLCKRHHRLVHRRHHDGNRSLATATTSTIRRHRIWWRLWRGHGTVPACPWEET